jgi:hypothetical protein
VAAEATTPSAVSKRPRSETRVRTMIYQAAAMQAAASKLCDPADLWARAQSGVRAISKSGSIPNRPPTSRNSMSPPPAKAEMAAPAAIPDTRCVVRFV